jgi:hypothetical protein
MNKVVKSFNIFVDTDRGRHTGSCTADDYELNLSRVNIDAGKNQHIRLTVQNFSMFKNFTNVNQNNNKFRLVVVSNTGAVLSDTLEVIPAADYDDRASLSSAVQKLIISRLTAQPIGLANVTDGNSATDSVTPDKRLNIKIDLPVGHALGNVFVLSPDTANGVLNDSAPLLGNKKGHDENLVVNPIAGVFNQVEDEAAVEVIANNELTIRFPFPCQLQTEQFVYLRTNLGNSNLETSSLGRVTSPVTDAHHSDILGRFTIASQEFVQFDSPNNNEYFIDIKQNHLQGIKLRLTNSHNLPLPQIVDQNKRGNLSFTCVLRCDIIQNRDIMPSFSKPFQPEHPARFDKVYNKYDPLDIRND